MCDLGSEKYLAFKFRFELVPFFKLLIALKELTHKVYSFKRKRRIEKSLNIYFSMSLLPETL